MNGGLSDFKNYLNELFTAVKSNDAGKLDLTIQNIKKDEKPIPEILNMPLSDDKKVNSTFVA